VCSVVASNNLGARARLLPQAAMGVSCSLNHLVPSAVFPPFPLSSAAPALTPTTTTSHTSDRPVVLFTWVERGEEGEEERRERETNTPPHTHSSRLSFSAPCCPHIYCMRGRPRCLTGQPGRGGAKTDGGGRAEWGKK